MSLHIDEIRGEIIYESDGVFLENGTFKPFGEINLQAIQDRFAELVLAEFAKRELITDQVMSQVLSQVHTGFSVWFGEPFQDEQSHKFVARYVERRPLSTLLIPGQSIPNSSKVINSSILPGN